MAEANPQKGGLPSTRPSSTHQEDHQLGWPSPQTSLQEAPAGAGPPTLPSWASFLLVVTRLAQRRGFRQGAEIPHR